MLQDGDGDEIGLDWIVSPAWVQSGSAWVWVCRLGDYGGLVGAAQTSKRELEQMGDDDRGHENQSGGVETHRG